VHLSPSATRVELSAQGERFFFRTAWRDDVQARTQAAHAVDAAEAETAVVIDDGDPYGRALADAFVDAFEERGGQVIARERVERGEVDFAGLSRQIISAAPDIVVFEGLNPEGALIVKRLREDQYTGTFMAPDGVFSIRDFLQVAGPAAEGAVVSGGPVPDERFVARFSERFQREPSTPFVLQTYDAVTMLLLAVQTVAQDEGGQLTIDRERLAEVLHAIRHDGLTGTIEFDESGDRRGDTPGEVGLTLYRVREGRFEPIP
jgi:branched-chain amino acid transport system substrate-binding protein